MTWNMNDPQYQADLAEVKRLTAEKKCNAFDLMKDFAAGYYDPKTSGYKDAADAVIRIALSTAKDIDKLYKAFEKKYPD